MNIYLERNKEHLESLIDRQHVRFRCLCATFIQKLQAFIDSSLCRVIEVIWAETISDEEF